MKHTVSVTEQVESINSAFFSLLLRLLPGGGYPGIPSVRNRPKILGSNPQTFYRITKCCATFGGTKGRFSKVILEFPNIVYDF